MTIRNPITIALAFMAAFHVFGPATAQDGLRPGERTLLEQARYRSEAERHNVVVGMPEEYVRQAWGPPAKVNQSSDALGTFEQWVYERTSTRGKYEGSAYIHLRNGIVVSVSR